MKHMMLDIETLGTDPGCVILCMAAVVFNMEGDRDEGKRWNIKLSTSVDAGLWIDGDTLEWWFGQKPELMRNMMRDPYPLKSVLNYFTAYYVQSKAQYLWSHGSNFDIPILGTAYRVMGQRVPWRYKYNRDTRTHFWNASKFGYDPAVREKVADKHDPLSDCHRQVGWVVEAERCMQKGGV